MSAGAVAAFDLSKRAKLQVTGGDRVRFLNGQLTNDVGKAGSDAAIEASILNAKGRMNAHVFLCATPDSFMVDADPALRESLGQRLERYVIADDVEISDVTEAFALFHVIATPAPEIDGVLKTVRSDRFGFDGSDLWFAIGDHDRAYHELGRAIPMWDGTRAENLRIERGIARWGCELSEEIIPVEANLEARAIDYAKGCYIGQEVISRMKMSGQKNKRLCGLLSLSGAAIATSSKLFAMDAERKEVGWVTSATSSLRLKKEIALGFVKRGFNAVGTRLLAPGAEIGDVNVGVPVEVVALPFDCSLAGEAD
ncbi:MAG: YgfZ/GcvT domain-containing protein [Chthoniobacterales bacterium]